ncbi:MAG: nitrite reductase small subunit NirD [Pseudomonadales bacterium]|nr:nitrite reductase small subunit NirD [Pseudomonadales bacterium]
MTDTQWIQICQLEALPIDAGTAALLDEGKPTEEQIALFRITSTTQGESTIFAVSNFDPFSEANVISRGILCSIGDELAVASPIGKQHFCLNSGTCFEDEDVALKTYPSKIADGQVYVQSSELIQE